MILGLIFSANTFALQTAKIRINIQGAIEPPLYTAIHNTELTRDQFDCYSKNQHFDCNAIAEVKHFLPKWRIELNGTFNTVEMKTQLFLICSDGSEVAINNTPFFSRRKDGKAFHVFDTNIDITDTYFACKNKTGLSPTQDTDN